MKGDAWTVKYQSQQTNAQAHAAGKENLTLEGPAGVPFCAKKSTKNQKKKRKSLRRRVLKRRNSFNEKVVDMIRNRGEGKTEGVLKRPNSRLGGAQKEGEATDGIRLMGRPVEARR